MAGHRDRQRPYCPVDPADADRDKRLRRLPLTLEQMLERSQEDGAIGAAPNGTLPSCAKGSSQCGSVRPVTAHVTDDERHDPVIELHHVKEVPAESHGLFGGLIVQPDVKRIAEERSGRQEARLQACVKPGTLPLGVEQAPQGLFSSRHLRRRAWATRPATTAPMPHKMTANRVELNGAVAPASVRKK